MLAAGDVGEIGAPIAVLVTGGETDADIDAALSGEAPAAPPATPMGIPAVSPPASAPDPAAPAAPDAAAPSAPSPSAPFAVSTPAPSGPSGPSVPSGPSGPAVPAAHRPYESEPVHAAPRARIFASPIVRKLAREQGIDLAGIPGTGPNGRIVRRDLERLAAGRQPAAGGDRQAVQAAFQPAAPQPAAAASQGAAAPESAAGTLIPHTPIRRAIARRLTESKATAPHFYMTTECVVDELLALRERINETAPVKISVNDFVIMAVAAAFRDVPEANVTWRDEGLVAYPSVERVDRHRDRRRPGHPGAARSRGQTALGDRRGGAVPRAARP